MSIPFSKYHGLGNDYLVINPADLDQPLSETMVRQICHRNYGIGSDGILLGPLPSARCDVGLKIFNPDGGEAEKSGNGLRIFARYLWDHKLIATNQCTVETLGGPVACTIDDDGKMVTVEMGEVSFLASKIPVTGADREVLNELIEIGDASFRFCGATVGNPHCVILCPAVAAELAQKYGPLLEVDRRFPNRTNVQFLQCIDRKNIRIEIWERGAGYTLASGSSSTAAAAVACKLGLCDREISVHMPGGALQLSFSDNFAATMTGPVTRVGRGEIDGEIFAGS